MGWLDCYNCFRPNFCRPVDRPRVRPRRTRGRRSPRLHRPRPRAGSHPPRLPSCCGCPRSGVRPNVRLCAEINRARLQRGGGHGSARSWRAGSTRFFQHCTPPLGGARGVNAAVGPGLPTGCFTGCRFCTSPTRNPQSQLWPRAGRRRGRAGSDALTGPKNRFSAEDHRNRPAPRPQQARRGLLARVPGRFAMLPENSVFGSYLSRRIRLLPNSWTPHQPICTPDVNNAC
jgi:hypothetical protein